MKIERLHLESHPLFGTVDISFTGPDRKALDTVVFTGMNGTGKSVLLMTLLKLLAYEYLGNRDSSLQLEFPYIPGFSERTLQVGQWYRSDDSNLWHQKLREIDEKNRPKVIYMPAEINFEPLNVHTLSFTPTYKPIHIINQKMIADIPSYIASIINSEVFKDPELPARVAIDKICGEINAIFAPLEPDCQLIGLKPEGEKLPLFKNSSQKTMEINLLSAGEKQLFLRIMALRMLHANNSIILIDEPETSLHPSWQQKILSIYQKIGKNNQLIFASHSSHFIASIPRVNLKYLKKENGRIRVIDSGC